MSQKRELRAEGPFTDEMIIDPKSFFLEIIDSFILLLKFIYVALFYVNTTSRMGQVMSAGEDRFSGKFVVVEIFKRGVVLVKIRPGDIFYEKKFILGEIIKVSWAVDLFGQEHHWVSAL